jgi:glutamyl/glutaminyl-tRNA synthetase
LAENRCAPGFHRAQNLLTLARCVKVRFAPSPTGSLHLGNALSAVANRRLGDWMLLRIDDTDPARNVSGGEEAILRDLEWLGVDWDEGPVRQSERAERHREVGAPLGDRLRRRDAPARGRLATYHLASVVDDIDFGITHVVRGNDHRPNESSTGACSRPSARRRRSSSTTA